MRPSCSQCYHRQWFNPSQAILLHTYFYSVSHLYFTRVTLSASYILFLSAILCQPPIFFVPVSLLHLFHTLSTSHNLFQSASWILSHTLLPICLFSQPPIFCFSQPFFQSAILYTASMVLMVCNKQLVCMPYYSQWSIIDILYFWSVATHPPPHRARTVSLGELKLGRIYLE